MDRNCRLEVSVRYTFQGNLPLATWLSQRPQRCEPPGKDGDYGAVNMGDLHPKKFLSGVDTELFS